NNYMKNSAFKFQVCCICAKKKPLDQIHKYLISSIRSIIESMKTNLKFIASQIGLCDQTQVPIHLLEDLHHNNSELTRILLCKQGISNKEGSIHICKTCLYSIKQNKIPKFSLANGTWIGCIPSNLPKLTMIEEMLIARYRCRALLIKLRYSNNSFPSQRALKGNIVSFAQNPETTLQLINTLPISLDALCDLVAVHFIGDKHRPVNIITSCKLLYVRRTVVHTWHTWLTWLQENHVGYKDMCIDVTNIGTLPENNIPSSILRSIFKSTNVDIADAEHRTNITDLDISTHLCEATNTSDTTFDISGLVDFQGTDITDKEMMSNSASNLREKQYLSYTHGSIAINEYSNPHLLTCRIPTLFPYGVGAPEMQHRTTKISLEAHVQYLLNLDDENHGFLRHHLFPFFMFNLIQRRQICRGARLTVSRTSFVKESQILNNIRSIDFNDVIKDPTTAFQKPGVGYLIRQLKASSKHVMAYGSSRAVQRD
ncbi:MAG TPA: DUF6570 domain-containing protein, partial [Candidatus Nitrosocosmicus sp.]|nr:DUF6570 domain-containing protein [Candidatus Nitrosocosmicus sp.]